MYTLMLDGTVLHDYRLAADNALVVAPTLNRALNAIETLTFSIPPDNPLYDAVAVRNSTIAMLEDGEEVWWGRVLEKTKRFDGMLVVVCESDLAFLQDSVMRPFAFKGTPQKLLEHIIAQHNAQVDASRRFVLGTCTVTDPNNYIARESSYPMSCWEAITEKLVELLGGYLRVRRVEGVRYLDYLEDFVDDGGNRLTSNQTVEFGKNLLSLEDYVTGDGVITCLIPYGAQYDYDDPHYEEEAPQNPNPIEFWHGNALTLDVDPSVNGGSDTLKNQAGIALFGEVYGTNTWDDVTIASNLKTKGEAWLAEQIRAGMSLQIGAADLSYIQADLDKIMMGQYTRLVSKPHGVDMLMLCTGAVLHLDAPQNNVFYFGKQQATISNQTAKGLRR